MKRKQEGMEKVTLLLSNDDVKYLDEIAINHLTGSRGRAVMWLIRQHKASERK